HAMHSYLSTHTQVYPKAYYPIFLAEIASTTNEVLLIKYLLSKTDDKEMKKYLLSHYIDKFRSSAFRQSMFAEFEEIAHSMEEKGEPLTSDALSKAYYELNQKYYGPAVVSDKDIEIEWARIPHFYGAFYVYKYSTGLITAVAIANKILQEGEPMVKKYMEFLSAGGCDTPINILKKAGIDLTTKEPFQYAMDELKNTIEELKKLM
ncbi:MAG: M3 family metallopeptidase, partial [Oscillospiraceae bacterium]